MSKCKFVLVAALAAITQPSYAGTISGVVNVKAPEKTEAKSAEAAKPAPVVVWVEGIQKFEVPKEKPQISQKDAQFTPSFLVVVAGQTVEMPNNDNIAHNVFSFSPTKKFNLGIYPKGESKDVTFDQTGVVEIFCSIHRHMNAKVMIVPNPSFAQTNANEAYKIENVPAGTYTVKVWHEGYVCKEQSVTVADSGEVKLDLTMTPEEPKQQ